MKTAPGKAKSEAGFLSCRLKVPLLQSSRGVKYLFQPSHYGFRHNHESWVRQNSAEASPTNYLLQELPLPVYNYTNDRLPNLLDFVETGSSWGARSRELGRRTFQESLGQPGFSPEENCILLDDGGRLQGYCLVFPEIPIGRAVIELKVATDIVGSSEERELVRRAVDRATDLGVGVVHVCLPESSPQSEMLNAEGFTLVRAYWDMVWREASLPAFTALDRFSIRSFQSGDASILAEAQNEAFAASWGFCPNTVEQIEYRSLMANTSHQGILFLSHGENTAGYCWTCLVPVEGGIRGMIGMIGVVPDFRGQGISHAILLAGMEYLRTLDIVDIGLQVDGTNTPGVRLYTSVGFQKVGELHWFERDLS